MKDYKKPFNSLSISDTLKILETNLDGLSSQTAAERLGLYGKNMLSFSFSIQGNKN
ncbi:cation-transporting P-type ATPase [Caldicellulosiruptoraceae bacterium PP1]